MDHYVKINIKESVRAELKKQAQASGRTLAEYIEWLAENSNSATTTVPEVDLVEQIDSSWKVDPLIKDLGPDDLPECCQTIFSDPTSHCCHWEDRRPVGYYNKLTRKWANDPSYYQYV